MVVICETNSFPMPLHSSDYGISVGERKTSERTKNKQKAQNSKRVYCHLPTKREKVQRVQKEAACFDSCS